MVIAQEKGGGDETGPYDLVARLAAELLRRGPRHRLHGRHLGREPRPRLHLQPRLPAGPEGRRAAPPTAFIPARNASGYDLSQKDPARHPRWDHVFNVVDRDGKLIESWDQHNKLFVRPHRILVNPYDPERHVWLVDDGAHAIYKFTRDGKKLVMTVGTPMQPGNDATHFNRPTDVAWLPDGTFFVSDGYVNTRVVKFDKNGKFLLTWGAEGQRADRDPARLHEHRARDRHRQAAAALHQRPRQLAHPGLRRERQVPRRLAERAAAVLAAAVRGPAPVGGRRHTQKFTKFDLNGRLLFSWGTFGAFPGGFWGVHQFHTDTEGNLYTADVHVGRPQKFRPKKGANPAHIIGTYMRGTN